MNKKCKYHLLSKFETFEILMNYQYGKILCHEREIEHKKVRVNEKSRSNGRIVSWMIWLEAVKNFRLSLRYPIGFIHLTKRKMLNIKTREHVRFNHISNQI